MKRLDGKTIVVIAALLFVVVCAAVSLGVGYIALDVLLIKTDKAGETPKYFKDVDDVPKEA